METSQNNNNTKKLDRTKMVILLLVSSLSCLALYLYLSLLNPSPKNGLEILMTFTPMIVFFCITFFLMEDIKKAEIIARKEEESKMWFNESMRLFGIVQEAKAHAENMQKEMDGKDPVISKTTQDLYRILSNNNSS